MEIPVSYTHLDVYKRQVKNGTNGFFRPVMKELMTKDQNTPAPAEPFYTCPNISQVTLLADREGTETVDIVGGLCSRYDLLASNVTLPRAEVGDRLLFTNAGSYGYTLSPLQMCIRDSVILGCIMLQQYRHIFAGFFQCQPESKASPDGVAVGIGMPCNLNGLCLCNFFQNFLFCIILHLSALLFPHGLWQSAP